MSVLFSNTYLNGAVFMLEEDRNGVTMFYVGFTNMNKLVCITNTNTYGLTDKLNNDASNKL